MKSDWPFDQPRNCASITSRKIMSEDGWISHVYHDEEDHGWQFHPPDGTTNEELMLVCLSEIVDKDPTVLDVADLQPGWTAWRDDPNGKWNRKRTYEDATKVLVDWKKVESVEVFYDIVLSQCGSPSWHGRNLDALSDSWISGGIDAKGPPYWFIFQNGSMIRDGLSEFAEAVRQIARESVQENGGICEEQNK